MTALEFTVLDIRPQSYAATPTLAVRLRITEATGEPVHALALRCQVRIEPQRRSYAGPEQQGLTDLFGVADRWGDTLKPFLWTQVSTLVPGFTGSVDVDLPLVCTYDFDVTAAKYLHALRDGEVPLLFLFGGTVFTRGVSGFSVEQVPWHSEAAHRLPVRVWRELMDVYFPHSGWLRLDQATLDRLVRYKSARALTSWEQVFDELVPTVGEESEEIPV
jgi:Family of unknown function (DUF6084)